MKKFPGLRDDAIMTQVYAKIEKRYGRESVAGGILMTEDAEEQDRQEGIWVLLLTLTAALGCGIVITVKKKKEEM